MVDNNRSKVYCYRHQPDSRCQRRTPQEDTVAEIQKVLMSIQRYADLVFLKTMDILPLSDRQAITHIWSLFSAAPPFHRKLILQGILSQCCFPQLSFISSQLTNSFESIIFLLYPLKFPTKSFHIRRYESMQSSSSFTKMARNG